MAIFIDWSPLYIRCALCNGLYKQNPTEDTLRHMVLACILSIRKKFANENIIIAADGRKSWRKEYYPYYKIKRQQTREASNINWTELFSHANNILQEIKKYMKYVVLQLDNAEADDIIAVLAKYIEEKHVIISSDKDYKQLVTNDICIYDPIKKKYITEEYDLLDHIMHGDSADSIPNILSADDCIAIGKKQTPLTKQKREYLTKTSYSNWSPEIQHYYNRNDVLINFDNIPTVLQKNIIKEYENYDIVSGNMILQYFIDKKLKYLIKDIGIF